MGEPPRRRRPRPGRARARRGAAGLARAGLRGGARPARRWPRRSAPGTARFALPDRRRRRPRPGRPRAPPRPPGIARIDANRRRREELVATHGDPPRRPWIYLIVATGDIYEDIPQAQAAARAGADVIAVIRSTGQSLLDYVPEGATRNGYAGTYATQENFRLMRAALDDVSAELGRYVRLTNYASGLCMPEIAVLAGLERLDMMLNDAMYGILFRDINPQRTFVDQRFSRMVHARAGIIINTGEDNYLTTADAVDAAHTVTGQPAAQRVLRQGGRASRTGSSASATPSRSTRPSRSRSGWSWRTRCWPASLFPDAPLKWMPPTKHMTGDVFRGYLLDGFFNLAGALTGQGILLVGMMTEAVVTPWLSDRDLALRNVRYVLERRRQPGRGLRPAAGRLHRPPGRHRAARGGRPAGADRRPSPRTDGGDRRRHVRHHQAPGRRRQGPGRRRRARPPTPTTRRWSCSRARVETKEVARA